MTMPFGLGRAIARPSMSTSPSSACSKPARMLSIVVLPQPEGPTIATNSPSPTLRSIPAITERGPASVAKLLRMFFAMILAGITPPHALERLQAPHAAVQEKADHADDDHPRDDEVVAVAGIARVDDQVAEPGMQRDHLRRDDHEPGHAEAHAHAGDDLRQHRRDHHLAEQL